MPIPFKPQDRLKLERRPTGINAETRMSGPEKALTLGSAALDPMGTIAQMGLERLLGGKEESIFDNLVDNPRTGKQEIAEKREAFIPHVWKNSSGEKADLARKLYRKNFGWAPATKDKPADSIIIRRAQEEPGNRMITGSGRGSVFAEKVRTVSPGVAKRDYINRINNDKLEQDLYNMSYPESASYHKANKDSDGSQVGGSNVIVSAIRPSNPLLTLPNTSNVIKTHDTGKDALISLAGNKEGLGRVRRTYFDREKKAMPLATRGGYDAIIGNGELMLKESSPKDPGIRDAVKEQQRAKIKEKAFMRVPHEYSEIGDGLMPSRLWGKTFDGMISWPDARRPDPDLFSGPNDDTLAFAKNDVYRNLKAKAKQQFGAWDKETPAKDFRAKQGKISDWFLKTRDKNIIPTDNLKLGLRATEPDKWLDKALPKTKLEYGPEGIPAEDLKNPEVRKAFIDKWLSK